jgi:hypothetical protein
LISIDSSESSIPQFVGNVNLARVLAAVCSVVSLDDIQKLGPFAIDTETFRANELNRVSKANRSQWRSVEA